VCDDREGEAAWYWMERMLHDDRGVMEEGLHADRGREGLHNDRDRRACMVMEKRRGCMVIEEGSSCMVIEGLHWFQRKGGAALVPEKGRGCIVDVITPLIPSYKSWYQRIN